VISLALRERLGVLEAVRHNGHCQQMTAPAAGVVPCSSVESGDYDAYIQSVRTSYSKIVSLGGRNVRQVRLSVMVARVRSLKRGTIRRASCAREQMPAMAQAQTCYRQRWQIAKQRRAAQLKSRLKSTVVAEAKPCVRRPRVSIALWWALCG
jgi:hypothetical protein